MPSVKPAGGEPPPPPTTSPSPPQPRLGLTRLARPVRVLVLTLVMLIGLLAWSLYYLRPASPGQPVTIDGVLRASEGRQIFTARFLDQDARVTGTMSVAGSQALQRFHATYPKSDVTTGELLKTLVDNGAEVSVDAQSTKAVVRFLSQFLLPLVLLANLFALLFLAGRAGGGGLSEFITFGRLGDRRLKAQSPSSFAEVAGVDEAVAELADIRDYLADPSAFRAMGAEPPKGALLVGPPGCGKTLLARAIAGEANASFFALSGSEFVESLVGVGASRVRDLFRQARAASPAILFIDEIDAVGRRRGAGLGGGHDEREQTLNELLVQMDGFAATEGLVVLAATNRPDILDPALLRPGRFDRRVMVERPDVEARLKILRLHAHRRVMNDPDKDLPAVAAATTGFTGADLANVVNEAALLAVRERAGSVGRDHLDEAVERAVAGPRRRATVMSTGDKRRVAVHEAGHALVATAMGKREALERLSIVSRGGGIGHLGVLPEESLLPTSADMEAQVAIAMAGIAAETLVLGRPSTGAEADLARATVLARDMAGRFGFSERLGRARLLREEREVFLGRDYLLTQDVSQPTLEHLDAEVRRILDEQEVVAREIIVHHRPILDALCEALIHHETLKGDELRRALQGVSLYQWPDVIANGSGARPARSRTRSTKA